MASDEIMHGGVATEAGKIDGNTSNSAIEGDEMFSLFAAFDEVRASDQLKEATLATILSHAGETPESGQQTSSNPVATGEVQAGNSPAASTRLKAAAGGKATGGKAGRAHRKPRWRAIRVAAIAACLAMALGGGVAYATPAQYYEVEQGGSTITLGVNCFGMTVSVSAGDDAASEIIEASDLRNMPYEESLSRAVELMMQHDPNKPVEFGPQGGEHEVAPPAEGNNPGRYDAGDAQPSSGPSQDGLQQPQGADAGQGTGGPQSPSRGSDDGQGEGSDNRPSGNEASASTAAFPDTGQGVSGPFTGAQSPSGTPDAPR